MTQRSVHTTVPSRHPWLQGHLSILGHRSNSVSGALVSEERGARHKRHPTTMDGLVSPEPWMAGGDLGAMEATHVLVRSPAFGVAYTEFANLLT